MVEKLDAELAASCRRYEIYQAVTGAIFDVNGTLDLRQVDDVAIAFVLDTELIFAQG